jgi:hypothetical protein
MSANRFVHMLPLMASIFLCGGAFAASKADLEQAMSYDGLEKTSVKGIDMAYARPGASLAGYNRIKIDPIEVAFSKNWDPTKPGSSFKLSTDEREKIRTSVAKIVNDQFVKVLQAKSSYQVVNETGPDVLLVKPSIVNLYVNAPDVMTAGRVKTYTVNAGEMTLYAELYDSETGQIIARVVDRAQARNNAGGMMFSNSITNRAEAENIASNWARILRDRLDAAHGIGKK